MHRAERGCLARTGRLQNGQTYTRVRQMNAPSVQSGARHARKRVSCEVLMVHQAESWSSDLQDISATGLLVVRPLGWKGCPGDLYSLDLMFGDDLHIHLEATIARITRSHLGFEYARIPEDKETSLWNLLGGYADSLEAFES
jgi:hypothetical protein